MIIAVNTRLLLKNRLEGIGWFMHENLKRITAGHPEHKFLFLFDRPYSEEFIYGDNVIPVIVPPPARHPVLWYAWLEYGLPKAIRKHNAELYMGPDGYMPLRLDIPSHITIHDINFHHRPNDLPWTSRTYYQRYFPRFANAARRIATVSEYSRSDIISSYGTNPEIIDVVYNGVNEIFSPFSTSEANEYRNNFTGGTPYFIFIGALHPRKNIATLLRAFDRFRTIIERDFKLVIVGEKMFMTGGMKRAYQEMKHNREVIFTGRLSPHELRRALGASAGLTFIPLFEGFGIPLLEAMRCEVPILASNVTSLPEVAGEAAIYTDPFSIPDIVDGMVRLATDKDLVSKIVNSGKIRAGAFSWDKTSKLLWESVSQVIDQC